EAVSIPIMGIGGICSVQDARKFFIAGASAIQVGTALWVDPGLPMNIIAGLESHSEWMRKGPF
ncbi:MAG: dihydroorotate dehydrogenase, partial [Candidatus Krumholzibacteria bacterium]|nr:dihydroorotate dehydrogenase [Candidatus Krumholzibacteria bacterium]